MPLLSTILAGCPRLENALAGGPSVKKGPPHDDEDAVQRIQRALVALGFNMPSSFPNGPGAPPDGKFGTETYNAVWAFQKREFASSPSEWDGRVGRNTLTRMDLLLPKAAPIGKPFFLPPECVTTTSNCKVAGAPPQAGTLPQATLIKTPQVAALRFPGRR